MPTQENRIRLIHNYRNVVLNHMFDELCRKPAGPSVAQIADAIVGTSRHIQKALLESDEIQHPARDLFVLALQQVVDSFIAGLLDVRGSGSYHGPCCYFWVTCGCPGIERKYLDHPEASGSA
jgi:hypothetical protein